jgi:hypothetical protein
MNGCRATVERHLDFDGAVVLLGRAGAGNLVFLVEGAPAKEDDERELAAYGQRRCSTVS